MKKSLSVGFALVLVISLLLAATGTVVAAPLNGGPGISPSSGGGTATLTTIPISKLPGTEADAAGTLFPIGHSSGDLMFSGNGVQVSGLVGSASLSMPLANYAKGWNGSIYQWLNNAWVKIPTSVSQNDESANGTASATIYSNGIYALIVEFKLPDDASKKVCFEYETYLFGSYGTSDPYIYFGGEYLWSDFTLDDFPVGTTFRYTVISTAPGVTFSGDTSGFVTVIGGDGNMLVLALPADTYVNYTGEITGPPFIFRVFINGCKVDFVVNEVS